MHYSGSEYCYPVLPEHNPQQKVILNEFLANAYREDRSVKIALQAANAMNVNVNVATIFTNISIKSGTEQRGK